MTKNKGFAANRTFDGSCGPYQQYRAAGNYPICNWVCYRTEDRQSCNAERTVCTTVQNCVDLRCENPQPQFFPEISWWNFYNCFPKVDPRNPDHDLVEDPPTSNDLQFRVPFETLDANGQYTSDPTLGTEGFARNATAHDNDAWIENLAPLLFASSNKTEVKQRLEDMKLSGKTRIPVGLMWGGFTLSPKWRGVWPTNSAYPRDLGDPYLTKAIVLMTDGKNFMRDVWNPWDTEDRDDVKLEKLCKTIKEDRGITIYTVGFGDLSTLNTDLLRNCASKPNYYFYAPTDAELNLAFKKIADSLLYNTLRLSK